MEELMQKTLDASEGCHQKDRTESESYGGAQTFIGIVDEKLVEIHVDPSNLLEYIINPYNLNRAYCQVVRNMGVGGVDKMGTSELLPYLKLHKDELMNQFSDGNYRPYLVRRVEIPKDNGNTRQLGNPTVVDHFVQQAISQVLMELYEPQFSDNSFGFRPNRSTHDALRKVQRYAEEGYR